MKDFLARMVEHAKHFTRKTTTLVIARKTTPGKTVQSVSKFQSEQITFNNNILPKYTNAGIKICPMGKKKKKRKIKHDHDNYHYHHHHYYYNTTLKL